MASLRSALPIAILLSIRHISLHSCQSWSVHESSVAVQKAAYLDNHLLCRIVGPLLQNAASHGAVQSNCEHRTRRAHDRNTKTGIAGHDWRFTIRVCKEHVRHPSGFGRCPIEYRPSVPYDCNPGVTMCLSGPFLPMISVEWWCVNARLEERHLEVNYEPASLLCHSQQSPIF
jgi:hypothetical protein